MSTGRFNFKKILQKIQSGFFSTEIGTNAIEFETDKDFFSFGKSLSISGRAWGGAEIDSLEKGLFKTVSTFEELQDVCENSHGALNIVLENDIVIPQTMTDEPHIIECGVNLESITIYGFGKKIEFGTPSSIQWNSYNDIAINILAGYGAYGGMSMFKTFANNPSHKTTLNILDYNSYVSRVEAIGTTLFKINVHSFSGYGEIGKITGNETVNYESNVLLPYIQAVKPYTYSNPNRVIVSGNDWKSIKQTDVYIGSNNYMGIGINNPTERLHVVGNVLSSGNVRGATLQVSNKVIMEYDTNTDTLEFNFI